jgi:hypothetical protein
MTAINPIKSGLVLGSFIGLWHLTWSLMLNVAVSAALILIENRIAVSSQAAEVRS